MFKQIVSYYFPLIATVMLALSACSPTETPTATVGVEAIYTAAAQTIEAKIAKTTDVPQPTETPRPTQTETSTLAAVTLQATAPTATSIVQNYCDNSIYVADVTIPDKTVMTPGQGFDKTWTLQNTGTCTWSTNYSITFLNGAQMSGSAHTMTASVAPQQKINITVKMIAPGTASTYTGWWRLANADGAKFGQPVSVIIIVPGGTTTATATRTATASTPAGTITVTLLPSSTPTTPAVPSSTLTPPAIPSSTLTPPATPTETPVPSPTETPVTPSP